MTTITIEIKNGNDFTVRLGDRYADRLCWDEMLGQIVHLTHPNIGDCRERYTMLTAEEHEAKRKRWEEMAAASASIVDGGEAA